MIGNSNYYENYYNTNNWAEKVYSYKTLYQKDLYNGIDLKIYSSNGFLKYDLIIHPNFSEKKIKIQYKGQNKIYLKNGNLIVSTSVNEIMELSPYSYQYINGDTIKINSRFKLKNNILSFEFPNGYDKNHKLFIDPTLIFSTILDPPLIILDIQSTYDNNGYLYSGSLLSLV